jgi:hypothetical protein
MKIFQVVIVILGLVACTTPTKPTWTKEGASATDLEHAEAECTTSAGVARARAPYAGVRSGPPRDEDLSARGRSGYMTCMEEKGYTRSP